MNEILFDFIAEGKVMVYMDDILIFIITIEENRSITAKVLARLRDNDLFAKPEKCFFEKRSIEYLGVIISQGHVEMDPSKLKAVLDWPTPKKIKHVQAFVGFANFYKRFIQDFSKIVQPLTSLTKKEAKWEWGKPQQEAFEALKKAFTTAPILRIPDDEQLFSMDGSSKPDLFQVQSEAYTMTS